MADLPLRLDDFLPYRLSHTSNLVSGSIAGTYAALFGLAIPQWRVLATVAERDGIGQREIGARTRMDKVTVSRAAIALVARGLLSRARDGGDRRSHRLALSEKGRALYREVVPKALELERRIFAGFDPAELAAFTAMLRRIDAAVLAQGGDGTA